MHCRKIMVASFAALLALSGLPSLAVAQEPVKPQDLQEAARKMAEALGQQGGSEKAKSYKEYRQGAPSSLLGLELTDSSGQDQEIQGMSSSTLELLYGKRNTSAWITIVFNDTGNFPGAAAARMAFDMDIRVESDGQVTETIQIDGRKAIRQFDESRNVSEASMPLGNRGFLTLTTHGMGDKGAAAAAGLPLGAWAGMASN